MPAWNVHSASTLYDSDDVVVLNLDSIWHGENNSHDVINLFNDLGVDLGEDWHAISEDSIASRPTIN